MLIINRGRILLPKINKESLPLKSDIGLLIYFILTSRIFSRILLIFIIGWLIRYGISSILTVNYLYFLDIITNIYYFFIACLITFSEVYGMLNNIPSIL
jgi:hypothetical protein